MGADGRGTGFRTFGDAYWPVVIHVIRKIPANVPTNAPCIEKEMLAKHIAYQNLHIFQHM